MFTSLADMVEEIHGIALWDKVLKLAKTESGGVYTAGKNYSDSELFSLVEALKDELGSESGDILRSFGEYFFNVLITRHPIFIEREPSFFGFLKSIKEVIHVEVKKLYDNTALPRFSYDSETETSLTLHYNSPRRLCMLSEGLIYAAASKYDVKIDLQHSQCMHRGDDQCTFQIEVLS